VMVGTHIPEVLVVGSPATINGPIAVSGTCLVGPETPRCRGALRPVRQLFS
jgi:hypothetical protein